MQWWRYAWPGFLATLAGVGLGRFAYTALLPFLVLFGALTPSEAAYLGAANLCGYLIGAACAAPLGRVFGTAAALRGALLLTTIGLAACVPSWGFWWYFPWRMLVGASGGVLMVLAAGFLYAGSPAAARGRIGGVIFTGVGVGLALSGIFVAPLAHLGLGLVWGVLALAAAAATALTWQRWQGSPTLVAPARRGPLRLSAAAWLTILGFAADGVGYTAHGLFWVDFIARGLGRGATAGALAWTLFGVGAAAGALLAGLLGDRIGLGRAFVIGLLIKSFGVFVPLLSTAPLALVASSLLVGAFTPAFPALASARLTELVAPADLTRAWGLATLAFAILQAIAGYAMSFAFAQLGSYLPLFAAGSLALFLGAGAAQASLWLAPSGSRPEQRASLRK
jgi:MFS family permease